MGSFDGAWATNVADECQPVFAAAGVNFTLQQSWTDSQTEPVSALLWEADPKLFAERYPDSGIVEAYGEQQWPGVHCIDFWVYVESEASRCQLSIEGWNLPALWLQLTGHGGADGASIADTFARILGIRSPRVR